MKTKTDYRTFALIRPKNDPTLRIFHWAVLNETFLLNIFSENVFKKSRKISKVDLSIMLSSAKKT